MIETLISSKTRIKLLLKFFLNSSTSSYLRGLEEEFNESSNSVRLELNRFEKAGMLTSELAGNKKIFRANTLHPLYNEVKNIVMKYVGIDKIIENLINNIGDVERVYLAGDFARGINGKFIDLVIIGNINETYLLNMVKKIEPLIHRSVRYLNFNHEDDIKEMDITDKKGFLLIWDK